MNAISKTNSALMEKWNKRITMTEKATGKALSIDRKNALAATLENTKNLLEATQVTSIGGSAGSYKRWA